MKAKSFLTTGLILAALGTATSCGDMLETDSSLVEFDNNNKIDHASDSVYSVIGIINKMQKIADRTVLLGEVRGDLVSLTPNATTDLQALANFSACGPSGTANEYNRVRDYYAVINNCNYYLANVDSMLTIHNQKVFEKEIAVVKAYRAWTYLQLALNYGSVPLVTEPVLTSDEATMQQGKARASLHDICTYFISDLEPYVNTAQPSYGTINSFDSQMFFIPVRVLLGDLCLWDGRYRDAAQYYHDYFTQTGSAWPTGTFGMKLSVEGTSTIRVENSYRTNFTSITSRGTSIHTFIPMETSSAYGEYSTLANYIFNSTDDNEGYYQVAPSAMYQTLSDGQQLCMVRTNTNGTRDTLYVNAVQMKELDKMWYGDLRLYSTYATTEYTGNMTNYAKSWQNIYKYTFKNMVSLYRIQQIYLRYAEALNRAGYPEAAFCVLKYGMTNQNVNRYVNANERNSGGTLLTFNQYDFTEDNTLGIHSFGSGDAAANAYYALPQPATPLANYADTVAYQQPLVEDIICEEMALETAMEGDRFYDLMRMAMRRGDPSYLASRVAQRNGSANFDPALYNKLLNTANWYLPLN